MKQVTRKSDVIGVSKDAYFYLRRIMREQRGCKPLTEEQEGISWERTTTNKDGLKELDNNSMGGGDGTYYGKWTSWNVDTLRQMLKDGGFTWVEYGERESIEIYL